MMADKDLSFTKTDVIIPTQSTMMFAASWPSHHQFPHNDSGEQTSLYPLIFSDLLQSPHPRIITGFTSLLMLLDFLDQCSSGKSAVQTVRIVLGYEPPVNPKQLHLSYPKEIKEEIIEYWLERGISPLQCQHLLGALKICKSGVVTVRITRDRYHPVHAKIFEGAQFITCGSSNFSQAGLRSQIEANNRFDKDNDPDRYQGNREMADAIWDRSDDFTQQFIELLSSLLNVVSWQDALARGCAELLEGEWMKRYQDLYLLNRSDLTPLWPSQEAGIAQAMWIIERIGSVLIADATGSGKTRMGARLIQLVKQYRWSRGPRQRQEDHATLICPPSVLESWQKEALSYGCPIHTVSHGLLSQKALSQKIAHELATQAIHQSHILAVDEAHNYLTRKSERTKQFFKHGAEHVLLFTATPLNRTTKDLLMMMELLGADNFDDDVLDILTKLWAKSEREIEAFLSPSQKGRIRQALQEFIVRRTKIQLNQLIDRDPERYRSQTGHLCRYPKHQPHYYDIQVSSEDKEIVRFVQEQAGKLRGMTKFMNPLSFYPHLYNRFSSPQHYVDVFIQCARGLAIYNVIESLRSSRAALLERILGTDSIVEQLRLEEKMKSQETGNILHVLNLQAQSPVQQTLEDVIFPEWLRDEEQYVLSCQREKTIYQSIAEAVSNMSDFREHQKADLLYHLIVKDHHPAVLAFDSHIITLYDIKRQLETYYDLQDIEIDIATGNKTEQRKKIRAKLALGSSVQRTIVLCSDAMSEGINLQAASALVHLDMPSVIRTAEQRVGRIDRMDSPHSSVEIYWPREEKIFALRRDEQFYARMEMVDTYIGANIFMPEEIHDETLVNVEEIHQQTEKALDEGGGEWQGIQDAFAPIRSLIEGESALIDIQRYKHIHSAKTKVISSVSVVESSEQWAFFTIGREETTMPFWIFLTHPCADPIVGHENICRSLRERLGPQTQDRSFDNEVSQTLELFLSRLHQSEYLLLPNRLRRAYEEMGIILNDYLKKARKVQDIHRVSILSRILGYMQEINDEYTINRAELAEKWWSVVFPVWYEALIHPKSSRPSRLRDIRQKLLREEIIPTEMLEHAFSTPPTLQKPLAERIVAAIIGVPKK
jgi:superfamily II DNA or RNA helicase